MARYRKIEVAVWFDDRFQSLSPAKPSGQHLWLYLLCGPRTTSFPGLLVGREEVMAADLGWPIGPFREAFREASREALAKADWKAGVVVLRKALLDSTGEPRDTAKPESPNVIKSWAKSWDEIPDCQLKAEYLQSLESFAKGLGEAFHQAFREGFRKALLKASTHPSLNQKQEQEQEQKQEQEEKNSARPAGGGVQQGMVGLESAIQRNLGDIGLARARGRKPKTGWTETEIETANFVLSKLSGQNGVHYTGTQEHQKLIINLLRRGLTEVDLRAIVGYCAVELEWKDKPEMRAYLRPETLFGSQTHAKYLDPARQWVASLPDDQRPQPRDEVSQ